MKIMANYSMHGTPKPLPHRSQWAAWELYCFGNAPTLQQIWYFLDWVLNTLRKYIQYLTVDWNDIKSYMNKKYKNRKRLA